MSQKLIETIRPEEGPSQSCKRKRYSKKYQKDRLRQEEKTNKELKGSKRTDKGDMPSRKTGENAALMKFKRKGELKLQRKQEIAQLHHILGDRIFLFQKGQYVTSYSISMTNFLGKARYDLIFNVPLDYPKTPIKLRKPSGCEKGNPIFFISDNFNFKAKMFLKEKQPLVVQLNYLSTQWESLSSKAFRETERTKSDLFSQLITP